MSQQAPQGFSQSERKVYAAVSGGKFRLKANENSNPALVYTRVNKKGVEVIEECHDQLTGIIKTVEFDMENTLRPQVNITVFAGYDIKFGLGLMSGPAKAFLKTLPNVDLKENVTFKPKTEMFKKSDGSDGQSNSMLLQQDGLLLKQFFKKDAMNGMPESIKVIDKLTKKEKYDDSDQLAWLVEYTAEHTIKQLTATPAPLAPLPVEFDEDLPF